ncbi:hypothetical protein DFP73DRAFT_622250 [Morchella snyderi]|nr:hypothetical protein DFP73DRAFT_622250 [Morchella snyderi]
MPHRPSYTESTSSSPDLEFSPSRKNVFYIPIPPSGEIVFQSLTREQRRLLRNMGKPSPRKIFDESPPQTPDRRTFRRHSVALSPALFASDDNDNQAYDLSPKVRESAEKVRLYKERLILMRATRSPGSSSASISPVIESDVSTEKVVKVSHTGSAGVGYFGVSESDDPHNRLCGAGQADERKEGAWEPLFAGTDGGTDLALEGLGISVWTERNTTKLLQDACPEDNISVVSGTEREKLISGEAMITSADDAKLPTILGKHQPQSCHSVLEIDPPTDCRACEAAAMPVSVKTSDGEGGSWEPIFPCSGKGNSLGLEGLDISVRIGSTCRLEKPTQAGCSKNVVAVRTILGREEHDIWEDIILSDDELNVPAENTTTTADMLPPAKGNTVLSDAPSTPSTSYENPLPAFEFSPGGYLCCTGPVSRSVILLRWGWRGATFARKEGELNYLERRIEKARRSLALSR